MNKLDKLREKCFWQRRSPGNVADEMGALRSYSYRDKCGMEWGYLWIFKDENNYRIVRYIFGQSSVFKKFNTAYQALKYALKV